MRPQSIDDVGSSMSAPSHWNYYDPQYIDLDQSMSSQQQIPLDAVSLSMRSGNTSSGIHARLAGLADFQRPWMIWAAILAVILLLGVLGSIFLNSGSKPPTPPSVHQGPPSTHAPTTTVPQPTPTVSPTPTRSPSATPTKKPKPRSSPTATPTQGNPGKQPNPGNQPPPVTQPTPVVQPPPVTQPTPVVQPTPIIPQPTSLPPAWTASGRGEADYIEAKNVAETFVENYESLDWRSRDTFDQATFAMTQGARTRFWQQDERANPTFIANFMNNRMILAAQVVSNKTQGINTFQSQATFFVWMHITFTLWHQQSGQPVFTDTHTIVVLLASVPFGINNVTGGVGWEVSAWQEGNTTFPIPDPA